MRESNPLAGVFMLVTTVTLGMPVEPLSCKSISPRVSDAWCQSNCNHLPINCPTDECTCTTLSPTPAPPPGPPSSFDGPIFELDLFVNDPHKGWQPTGFPKYLQHSAANYTNVAGISFIQPADLMNDSYDLPP